MKPTQIIFLSMLCLSQSNCKTTSKSASETSEPSFFDRSKPAQVTTTLTGDKIDIASFRLGSARSQHIEAIHADQEHRLYKNLEFSENGPTALQYGGLHGLSLAEVLGINFYTGTGYELFAAYSQDSKNWTSTNPNYSTKDVEALFFAAISGLNRLPQVSGETLYFGMTGDPNVFDDIFVPGKLFINSNFTSTSLKKDVAYRFIHRGTSAEKKYLCEIISSTSGRKIKEFSSKKSEEEVLFLPKQAFRVDSVTEESYPTFDLTVVKLKEI